MAVALRRPLPVAAPKTVAVLTHEWVASWHLVAHFDGTDGRNSAAALARVFQASDAARANDRIPPGAVAASSEDHHVGGLADEYALARS